MEGFLCRMRVKGVDGATPAGAGSQTGATPKERTAHSSRPRDSLRGLLSSLEGGTDRGAVKTREPERWLPALQLLQPQ